MEISQQAYSSHRDPILYPNPEKFDIERWLPERETAEMKKGFIPFSSGVRQCVGKFYSKYSSLPNRY